MRTDQIRENFLKFFESKGHKICPPDLLVPQNDPSLLFTSAGMNQFKDMFLGGNRLPHKRIATCQRCLRTGDIDKVGLTAKHLTFFEMLGNFSFGDYFKEEAITWGWGFLTQVLAIPPEKLYASVYQDDEEAFSIWNKKICLSEDRIFRFSETDNFWPANARTQGPNGPCGPCSEIYYDFGEKYGCGKSTCTVGCDCDRYVEVWNLVFIQFDRQEGGVLAPLAQKNIDTGMGLERLAAVMQGVVSNFETDALSEIAKKVCEMLGQKKVTDRIRRIVDHLRAVAFCIMDGVMPSNEERGYVVRRLIRIALRDGYLMGRKEPFLHELVPVVSNIMGSWYKDLAERGNKIAWIVKSEEERFSATLEKGMEKLELVCANLAGKTTLPAEEAFMLYDSYGFPVEMTEAILREKGVEVDKKGFNELLEKTREQSRKAAKFGEIFDKGPMIQIKENFKPTQFLGYKKTEAKVNILAIIKDDVLVDSANEKDEVKVLCDETPFYAEAGGQVGDTGFFRLRKNLVEITDTKKIEDYFLHHGKVVSGSIKNGQKVEAVVNESRRLNIARNHTATHLLQAALRKILGSHVEQSGSVVEPTRLRFDFTHLSALAGEQIRAVEELVNEKILADLEVEKFEVSLDEAKKMGALMFFGEKYSDIVRVLKIADFSTELCGGTHLDNTSTIGLFKIISESSIGSGIRRIEAITGPEAIRLAFERYDLVRELSQLLKTEPDKLSARISSLLDDIKNLEREADRLKKQFSTQSIDDIANSSKEIDGNQVVLFEFKDERKPDELRSLIDVLIKKKNIAAVILSALSNGKPFFIVGIDSALISRGLKAGEIANELGAICGASGGGKDHIAQFGAAETSRVELAFNEFERILKVRLVEGK